MTKGKTVNRCLVLLLLGMMVFVTAGCGGDSNGDIGLPSRNENEDTVDLENEDNNATQPQEVGSSGFYRVTGQLRWPDGDPVVYERPRVTVEYTHGDGFTGQAVADADGRFEINHLMGTAIIELKPRDGRTGYTSEQIEVSGPTENIDVIITYSHHGSALLQGLGDVEGVKYTFEGPFGTKTGYSSYNSEKDLIICIMDGLWGEVTLTRSYPGYNDSVMTINSPSSSGATMVPVSGGD